MEKLAGFGLRDLEVEQAANSPDVFIKAVSARSVASVVVDPTPVTSYATSDVGQWSSAPRSN